MNKQSIINLINENYFSFANYINQLTPEEYLFNHQQKWSAAQQLQHIILCVKPLVQVFSLEKMVIAKMFGTTDRQNLTYEILLSQYLKKLAEGGKAPNQFLPEIIQQNQQQDSTQLLLQLINNLCLKIETFNENELDTLLIPHPLLGNLTFREMLYNTIYHVTHHQKIAEENLKFKL
jgi:DinB superfamily